MITLYAFGPMFGLPDASPYVMKTEIQLRMFGLAYEKRFDGYPTAPKGKLPYIDDAGTIVADSTFIRAYLEQKTGTDLDAGLPARDRAILWSVERMLEDHLAWAMSNERWLVPENFTKGPATFFARLPDGEREATIAHILAQVTAGQRAHGMGRHSREEVLSLARRSLDALAEILGDRPYLGGETPCGTDAYAASVLTCLTARFFDGPIKEVTLGYGTLVAHADRMMRRFYPDHPW